ncbi:hypothetical protein [Streptomyces sp. NPDC058486]|uniref:hypothetical protein n=1 Tax=unclassified Streptomyces TaxID=2593676 RepID=UPI00364D410E
MSTRPAAGPPDDVPGEHPLRGPGVVHLLAPSAHNEDAGAEARRQLDELTGTPLGRTVVALLLTVEEGLGRDELIELSGAEPSEFDRLLAGRRRILLPGGDGTLYALDAELRSWALDRLGEDARAQGLELLDAWADLWQRRRRPDPSPRPLLSSYPRLIRDPGRLERFVLDPDRQARLAAEGRHDEALAHIGLLGAGSLRELGVSARAAASRELLLRQVRLVPRAFPRLFARAGEVSRARELALGAPDDASRAVRLADVGVTLAALGSPMAAGVAREAAERARDAAARPRSEHGDAFEELADCAVELHREGLTEAARSVLASVFSSPAVSWPARVKAAKAFAAVDPGRLYRVLEFARELALRDADDGRAEALEILAELVPGRGEQQAAARELVESVLAEVDYGSDLDQIGLRALAASALKSVRRKQAFAHARAARDTLLHFLDDDAREAELPQPPPGPELATTFARVVQALVDVRSDSARTLCQAVPESLRLDALGQDVREPACRVLSRTVGTCTSCPLEKPSAPTPSVDPAPAVDDVLTEVERQLKAHPEHGRRLLGDAFARWEADTGRAGAPGWFAALAVALATAGHADAAVRLPHDDPDPAARVRRLADVAVGCAAGAEDERAGRYAQEAATAATAARPLADDALNGCVAHAFAHAGLVEAALQWSAPERLAGLGREDAAQVRVAVATGLARYDPRASLRIVEDVCRELAPLARVAPLRERLLPRAADLLLAVPDPRDPPGPVRSLLEAACARPDESVQPRAPLSVLVQGLLDATGCGGGLPPLGARLAAWETYMRGTALPPGAVPVTEWAVLHAVRGDLAGARAVADRAATPELRAQALAAVAAYLADVPVHVQVSVPVYVGVRGPLRGQPSTARFLALATALGSRTPHRSRTPRRSSQVAAGLAAEVLASGAWWHAVPLLPRLAPGCLPALADLALRLTPHGSPH